MERSSGVSRSRGRGHWRGRGTGVSRLRGGDGSHVLSNSDDSRGGSSYHGRGGGRGGGNRGDAHRRSGPTRSEDIKIGFRKFVILLFNDISKLRCADHLLFYKQSIQAL